MGGAVLLFMPVHQTRGIPLWRNSLATLTFLCPCSNALEGPWGGWPLYCFVAQVLNIQFHFPAYFAATRWRTLGWRPARTCSPAPCPPSRQGFASCAAAAAVQLVSRAMPQLGAWWLSKLAHLPCPPSVAGNFFSRPHSLHLLRNLQAPDTPTYIEIEFEKVGDFRSAWPAMSLQHNKRRGATGFARAPAHEVPAAARACSMISRPTAVLLVLQGDPVAINGTRMSPATLLTELNRLGGENGEWD